MQMEALSYDIIQVFYFWILEIMSACMQYYSYPRKSVDEGSP